MNISFYYLYKRPLYLFYKLYLIFDKLYFYMLPFKFARRFFLRFFSKRYVFRGYLRFFKPIFKVNFFLNFNFRFKKRLKFIKYKFFKRIKKILFNFKRVRNLRKSMFYFIFRRKSKTRLKFISLKVKKVLKKKKKLRKWKKKRRVRLFQINLKKNYRQFWSKNRAALNYFISFRAPTEHRKTKYFSQFRSRTPMQMFNIFNHNVFSMLYFSNFFYSYKQIMHFVRNQFIFKNGELVKSKYTVFVLGDRLNVVFSKRYYFYSIFINYIFYKKVRRLGYFHWKFVRFRWNFLKRRPRNPSSFYEKYIPYYSINPTFLEFDYKTLTIIYLLTNKNLRNLNEFYLKYINFYFFRLYNWKYII